MKSRITFLFVLVACLLGSTPISAAPPESSTTIVSTESESGSDTGTSSETGDQVTEAPLAGESESTSETGSPVPAEVIEVEAAPVAEISTNEEAVAEAKGVYDAVSNRDWALAIALGLTLVVFILRKVNILSKVPTKAVPWVTAIIGMVGYVSAALMTPGVSIPMALMEGLAAGASAVGLWEMAGRHFLGSTKPADAPVIEPSA